MKRAYILIPIVTVLILSFTIYKIFNPVKVLEPTRFEPSPSQEKKEENSAINQPEWEVVAENLKIPWEIAFLPDGDILVTERPGTLKRIGKNGFVYKIEGVRHIGEGGLLGLALHPEFEKTRWIYLYLTTTEGNSVKNRVERYRLENNKLYDRKIIIEGIPGSIFHDGGRIAFGPDNYLYITTGDARVPELAQDLNSLAGKILRVKDDGTLPNDNPFETAIWTYGHRNPQGLTWDEKKQLWATEHGPTGFDEINLIIKGKNYGWPIIKGDEIRPGLQPPVAHSGPDNTWAPSGAQYWDGSLFFAGLRGEAIFEAKIENNKIKEIKTYFKNTFGRLRTIKLGPDGYFYIITSNTDGRGNPRPGDDKLIKVNPKVFRK